MHQTEVVRDASEGPLSRSVYEAIGGPALSGAARALLHTRYHAVPRMELAAPTLIKW